MRRGKRQSIYHSGPATHSGSQNGSIILRILLVCGLIYGGYYLWSIRFSKDLVELPAGVRSGYTANGIGPRASKHTEDSIDAISRARRAVKKHFENELSLRFSHRMFEDFPEAVYESRGEQWIVKGIVLVHSHTGKQAFYDWSASVQKGGMHQTSLMDIRLNKNRR